MASRLVLLVSCVFLSISLFAQKADPLTLRIAGAASEEAYPRLRLIKAENKSDRTVGNPSRDFVDWLNTTPSIMFREKASEASEIINLLLEKSEKELTIMTAVMRYHDPVISNILSANKLETNWKFLPFVLTAGVANNSWQGGAGPWHLYFPHARKNGLMVSEKVDERLDFESSAQASSRILFSLLMRGKDHEAVVKEFALGPLYKEIKDPELKEWGESLPAQLLAWQYLYANRDRLGLDGKVAIPVPVDTVLIKKEVDLNVTATLLKANLKKLQEINETVLTDKVPAGYHLMLPDKFKETFVRLEDSIYNKMILPVAALEGPKIVVHIVRSGDTLSEISEKYGVPLSAIRMQNKLRGDMIYIGQKLVIPQD